MPRPMIFPNRNGDVFVEVEWNDQTLSEDVHDVVVAIRPVVELDTKCVLPLLRLQRVVSIGRVEDEAFKVQLADALDSGPDLEVGIKVVANAVLPLQKANLRIEVRANLAMVS